MSEMPASLARDPFVRAIGMTVHVLSDRQFSVTGGGSPHTVVRAQDALICDCTAANFGRFCSHVAAIHNLQQKEQHMGLVLNRGQERGTPVALPRTQKQLYAGLFSSWWLHDGQFGTSVGVKALVTHAAAGKSWEKVDQITEAVAFLSPSWFYNTKKNEASNLMRFVHALTNLSYQRLDPIDVEEVKKLLNEHIGTGILFSAEVTEKGNAIDKKTFDVADDAFSAMVDKMASRIEIRDNKDGNRYISKPQPTYEDESAAGASVDNPEDDGIPF